VIATLRAEFFVDDKVKAWHYRVPTLHINGGGASAREDAERQCMDAIAFASGVIPGSTTATPRPSPLRCRSLLPRAPCTHGDGAV
jgi:hypothetical protein